MRGTIGFAAGGDFLADDPRVASLLFAIPTADGVDPAGGVGEWLPGTLAGGWFVGAGPDVVTVAVADCAVFAGDWAAAMFVRWEWRTQRTMPRTITTPAMAKML